MKKHRIVIAPANTDLNRGDQALVWETAQILKDSYEEADITLISYGNSEKEKYLQTRQSELKGFKFIDPIIPHPSRFFNEKLNNKIFKSIVWTFVSIGDIIPRLMILSKITIIKKIGNVLLTKKEREIINNYLEFDTIAYKGGGFIHSYGKISDIYVFIYQLYYVIFAKRFNKKVVFLPNSFGPFKNKVAKKIYKIFMNKVDLITVREKISENQNNNILKNKSYFYPDLGFYIKKNEDFNFNDYLTQNKLQKNNHYKNIGITVRPYNFSGHKDTKKLYEKYIKSISEFIKNFQKEYNFYLIAQTMGPSNHENDHLAINAVQNNLDKKVNVISDLELNANDLVSIYSEMDYVIGTRFHSVIFSFTQQIPCIAISYGGNKGEGIMKNFSLEDYEIKIDEINEKDLIEMFKRLIKDKNVTKNISVKLEEYISEREKLILKIKKALGENQNEN